METNLSPEGRHVHCAHIVQRGHIKLYECCRCKAEVSAGSLLPYSWERARVELLKEAKDGNHDEVQP
mgnify:CR=1 FL=1